MYNDSKPSAEELALQQKNERLEQKIREQQQQILEQQQEIARLTSLLGQQTTVVAEAVAIEPQGDHREEGSPASPQNTGLSSKEIAKHQELNDKFKKARSPMNSNEAISMVSEYHAMVRTENESGKGISFKDFVAKLGAWVAPIAKQGDEAPQEHAWRPNRSSIDLITKIIQACGDNIELKKAFLACKLNSSLFSTKRPTNDYYTQPHTIVTLEEVNNFLDTTQGAADNLFYQEVLTFLKAEPELFRSVLPKYVRFDLSSEALAVICSLEDVELKKASLILIFNETNDQALKSQIFSTIMEQQAYPNTQWIRDNIALANDKRTQTLADIAILTAAANEDKTQNNPNQQWIINNLSNNNARLFDALITADQPLSVDWHPQFAHTKTLSNTIREKRSQNANFFDKIATYEENGAYSQSSENDQFDLDLNIVRTILEHILPQNSSIMTMWKKKEDSPSEKLVRQLLSEIEQHPKGDKLHYSLDLINAVSQLIADIETPQDSENTNSSRAQASETQRMLAYLYYLRSAMLDKQAAMPSAPLLEAVAVAVAVTMPDPQNSNKL